MQQEKKEDVNKTEKLEIFNNVHEYKFGLVCLFHNGGMRKGFGGINAAKKQSALTQKQIVKESTLFNIEYAKSCIKWCLQHRTMLYRLSSELVPFYEFWPDWSIDPDIKKAFREIQDLIKGTKIRLTCHPGQFTILNSNQASQDRKDQITSKAWRELEYHNQISELIGGAITEIIIHTGSKTTDYKERFIEAIKKYKSTAEYKKNANNQHNLLVRLVIENCHNVGIVDAIDICKSTGLRPVLDVHHDRVCPSFDKDNKRIDIKQTVVPEIIKLWSDFYKEHTETLPESSKVSTCKVMKYPIAHISTGKTKENDASHNDYISKSDADNFKWLWQYGFDVEIEAKLKDLAVLRIRNYLKYGVEDEVKNSSELSQKIVVNKHPPDTSDKKDQD